MLASISPREGKPGRAVFASVVLASILLTGCVSQTIRTVDMTPPEQMTDDVPEELLLDIGVAVFDANVPESYDEQIDNNIQPEVRRAESNYMAFFLKDLLQSTGNWGAVRVVPRPTHAVDVTVSGKIVHSDGERLIAEVKVRDARGVEWFDKRYEELASRYAYDATVPKDIDPFQAFYKQVADDMLAVRMELTPEEIHEIRTTAEMKFARSFSPDAFSTHVVETDPGVFVVKRLPAENDPMLARVRKIREREYLFIDTLDEYFSNFETEMFAPYQSWRRATYDEAIALRTLKAQGRARTWAGAAAIVGGIAAQTSDDTMTRYGGAVSIIGGAGLFKSGISKKAEAQIHAEVLQELGTSAEAEITPHTIELENETLRLQGTVDAQYDELRKILKKIYFTELGLPVPESEDMAEPISESAVESPDDAS